MAEKYIKGCVELLRWPKGSSDVCMNVTLYNIICTKIITLLGNALYYIIRFSYVFNGLKYRFFFTLSLLGLLYYLECITLSGYKCP